MIGKRAALSTVPTTLVPLPTEAIVVLLEAPLRAWGGGLGAPADVLAAMKLHECLQPFSTEAMLGQQIRWIDLPVDLAEVHAP